MDLDDTARLRLDDYLAELYRWNARLNLTTVPPAQAWTRHVEESLSILEVVAPPAGTAVIDVGSGAGLPGIPLAIARPDLAVTLLDADGRRGGFLLHVCGLLGLERVRVMVARAEAAGHDPALRETQDLAVSRATAAPAVLCELCLPLLRTGGQLLALVADAPAAVAGCAAAAERCGGGSPAAPTPTLLRVAKRRPTPAELPRRAGLPRRRPL